MRVKARPKTLPKTHRDGHTKARGKNLAINLSVQLPHTESQMTLVCKFGKWYIICQFLRVYGARELPLSPTPNCERGVQLPQRH